MFLVVLVANTTVHILVAQALHAHYEVSLGSVHASVASAAASMSALVAGMGAVLVEDRSSTSVPARPRGWRAASWRPSSTWFWVSSSCTYSALRGFWWVARARTARACQMTEAMRDVCERATAAEAEPMLDGVSGRTAPLERPRDEGGRQDGPGEERGDPRPLRQQARQRLPRGANSHTVRQEGDQRPSQRRVPRHRDLPRAGGCRSTPSLALRPSPCYPPETPKGQFFHIDTRVDSPGFYCFAGTLK